MRKEHKIKITWLFLALLISIPFYISASMAAAQTDANIPVQNTQVANSRISFTESDLVSITSLVFASQTVSSNISDPGDVANQCIAKHEQSSQLADLMDNDIIKILEQVSAVMYMIYTTMTAVHTILSVVSAFFSLEGGCCAGQPYTTAACGAFDGAKNAWDGVYNSPMVAALGCFVSCGWCTGQGNCGGFFANIPLFNSVPKVMSGARLSPYENIYTASACLCPTAILFNLRKLKTIYDTYDCCIQEACTNGISTQSCERMLDEATCMYWKGSLYKILVRIVMGLLAGYIQKMIINIIGKNLLLNCMLALFDLAQIPSTIQGVQQGYKWVSVTFSEPNCKDLGFEKIILEVQASKPIYKDVKVYDSNSDGRYDGFTEVVNGADGEVHSTKTNYAETAMTNNRAILNERGMIQNVETLPASGGVNIKQGDIITVKSTGQSYVVRETDPETASRFGYNLKTTDGSEITLMPTAGEGELSYDDIQVDRLSDQATPEDKKFYNGMSTAIHRYNKYERKEKVYQNDAEIGQDLIKGESAIVQRGEAFIQYSKDKDGNVQQREVSVIIDYSSRGGEYRPKIDGNYIEEPVIRTVDSAGQKNEYVMHKGQLYKREGSTGNEWKRSDDPEPIVVQGKTNDANIVRIKEQEKNQQREQRAYKAAWLLLDSTLGKYAYSKIDEMCKQEWESSEN
ncbi:MAG: hypothetical protein Q8Q31_04425 [Nanoarchaeota archaeon]|nr:hypothetical protein [Nanoarchaeota archaeon]